MKRVEKKLPLLDWVPFTGLARLVPQVRALEAMRWRLPGWRFRTVTLLPGAVSLTLEMET